MPRSDPGSGANIERTLTDDGSVVTEYTPRSRDDSGPVMIGTQRIGQDPRMAAQPNDALLEDSPHGRLPIVGPGGQRPMDQYARPWSGARQEPASRSSLAVWASVRRAPSGQSATCRRQ